jgi:UDP-N-acetylglucosamine 2-epimerase (non-hydrolysing)
MIKILKKNDLKDEIAIIVGTRPGIIKFSPVIHVLRDQKVPFFIIHTGQHYSGNMDKQFFEDLELPEPRYSNDTVREKKSHGAQTAEMIVRVEEALLKSQPFMVIVGGDANTNLAGALAARKLVNITLAHMEAGLRSNDWRMPEEHNRVMIDHISDILFSPTKMCEENLQRESVKGRIFITGNTIVDAVRKNLILSEKKSKIIHKMGLEGGKEFAILTLHREENVDSCEILEKHINNINFVSNEFKGDIIFPLHPRTKLRLKDFKLQQKLENIDSLRVIDPVGYLDMLILMNNAKFVMTDSGGIQEESCILSTPCITLRDNTERPETLLVGSNRIVGTSQTELKEAIHYFLSASDLNWKNPYGDGKAANRIVKIVKTFK